MHLKDFIVPDGSYYVAASKVISELNLNEGLQKLTSVIKKTSKTRVIWDNPNLDTTFTNYANSLLPSVTHKAYETNFFEIKRTQVQSLTTENSLLDLNQYSQKFGIKETTITDIDIIKDFMFSSFGVKFKLENEKTITLADDSKRTRIMEGLSLSLQNPLVKGYLIHTEDCVPCGFFALANLGDDVELHSVAGLSSYPPVAGVRKLQLIMAATLQIFEKDSDYTDCLTLTFSNSKEKVTQMYKDLGFLLSNTRKGLIFEI